MSDEIQIFIAYSRKDENILEEFRIHLAPIVRSGNITVWYDGKIVPGALWEDQIKENLHNADFILLLISARAIASEYFYNKELKIALDRHKKNKAKVIPLIISPCTWKATPLSFLQALPKDGKPITSWANRDEGYANIVGSLWKMIQQLEREKEKERNSLNRQLEKKIEAQKREGKKKRLTAWFEKYFSKTENTKSNKSIPKKDNKVLGMVILCLLLFVVNIINVINEKSKLKQFESKLIQEVDYKLNIINSSYSTFKTEFYEKRDCLDEAFEENNLNVDDEIYMETHFQISQLFNIVQFWKQNIYRRLFGVKSKIINIKDKNDRSIIKKVDSLSSVFNKKLSFAQDSFSVLVNKVTLKLKWKKEIELKKREQTRRKIIELSFLVPPLRIEKIDKSILDLNSKDLGFSEGERNVVLSRLRGLREVVQNSYNYRISDRESKKHDAIIKLEFLYRKNRHLTNLQRDYIRLILTDFMK